MPVSTHSRPKAAAFWRCVPASRCRRFNTQPPEGGCHPPRVRHPKSAGFNTQPPEGGCTAFPKTAAANGCFNTQPPEGGGCCWHGFSFLSSGFNTQPPEGGCQTSEQLNRAVVVSTHSRLKAAAIARHCYLLLRKVSTHSRLKAAARSRRIWSQKLH